MGGTLDNLGGMKQPKFKIARPTGKYASFGHAHVYINVGGHLVGYIGYDGVKAAYRVSLRVEDIASPGGWKNVTLKQMFAGSDDEQITEAKAWVSVHWQVLAEKFPICAD
jgi:hypothetical protein